MWCKSRQEADTKAAISMDYRSIVAVALDASLMKEEHRYPGLVERFKPDLFDLKHLWIKWYFALVIERVLESFEIQAIHGLGHQERRKRN
jgi:hypothetical protein